MIVIGRLIDIIHSKEKEVVASIDVREGFITNPVYFIVLVAMFSVFFVCIND